MKVYLCGYRTYFHLFYDRLVSAEENGKISKRTYDILFYINDKLCTVVNWIWQRTRFDYVKIDGDDIYSLDYKLSHVIHPALVKLRKDNVHSVPFVSSDDVPEELKLEDDSPINDVDIKFLEKRWHYVLDEMIYAFEKVKEDNIILLSREKRERVDNGLLLFGKYYCNLWI